MYLLQGPADKYYQKLGLRPDEFRSNFQEQKRLKQEEEKKFQEHLDSLVAQKEQREKEQQDQVRRNAKIKSKAKEGLAPDIRRSIQISKADQENKNLVKLRAERQRCEQAERSKVGEYTGGRLPQNELVRKAEQKREEDNQRLLQSVINANKQAKQKTLETPQKPNKPPRKNSDDTYLVKQREQTAVSESFTENVYLKKQRLLKEKQTEVQNEENCKRAASELDSKYESRKKLKQQQFQTQQIPKEVAAQNLAEVKRKEVIKAREEEERRAERYQTEQQAKREQEREQKDQKKGTVKKTAAYWRAQMERRQEKKSAELQDKADWFDKQCEKERVMKQMDQKKADEKRQKQDECSDINNKMAAAKNALARRKKIQGRKESLQNALCESEKWDGYRESVEEQIRQAKEENRIIAPFLDQQRKISAHNDPIFTITGHEVMRKRRFETQNMKNTIFDQSEEGCDRVCCTGTKCSCRNAESYSDSDSDLGSSSSELEGLSDSETDVSEEEDTKYDCGPKQREFGHKEVAARYLAELRKQEAIKAQEFEERRTYRDTAKYEYQQEQEREKRAQNQATAKNTAAYWRSQMELRKAQKKAEQQGKADWFQKVSETERILQEQDQRKAQEKRQKQDECNEINKIIAAKNAMAKRKEMQERGPEMEQAQRYIKKGKLNEVGERVSRSKVVNNIILGPDSQAQTDRRLYLTSGQNCEVVKSKVTPATRKIQEKNGYSHIYLSVDDVKDQVYSTWTGRNSRTAQSPVQQVPESPLGKPIVESSEDEMEVEGRPSCVPWHGSSEEAFTKEIQMRQKNVSHQKTPTQIIIQKVPANRVVSQRNSNVTKKSFTLPPIVPKRANNNFQLIVVKDGVTYPTEKKVEVLKLPPIPTARIPAPSSNVLQGRIPSVSNSSSVFRSSQSPVVKLPLNPNTLNLTRAQPILPPIAPTRTPALGPKSTNTKSIRVIPLTTARKY